MLLSKIELGDHQTTLHNTTVDEAELNVNPETGVDFDINRADVESLHFETEFSKERKN